MTVRLVLLAELAGQGRLLIPADEANHGGAHGHRTGERPAGTDGRHRRPEILHQHIRLRDQSAFTFAGLGECWHPPDGGEPVEKLTHAG